MFNDLYITTALEIPYDYYSTYGAYGANGGYSTSSTTTYGGAGGGSSGIATSKSSQNVYSITGLTSTSSTGSISLTTGGWTSASATAYAPRSEFDSDIVLKRNGKPELRLGAALDLVLESLYIIIPDNKELEQNPALKSAYEHWQEKFNEHKKLMSPVKEAYDSYTMIQKLVKEETEE